jgi:Pvc16 N-terminal domain/IPT/TIG domain
MSLTAIYSVTKGLRMLLHSQLSLVNPNAVVTLLPPGDALPEASGINLYLYRVNESPFSKNQPWPGDRATPPSNRPALGLQLFYLLTPLGVRPDNANFALGDDAHTMLGVAMSTLQDNPILNQVHIPDTLVNNVRIPGFDADSDLTDFLNSFEQVKVTLIPTTVDELSKIWATINQPYRLSIAYEVSIVELTPATPPPVSGGVVLTTNLDLLTLDSPRITALLPPGGAQAHVDNTGKIQANDITISGTGLSLGGQTSSVFVGGQPAIVKLSPAPTSTSLVVTLPSSIDAGPQEDVRVTFNGQTSAPVAFTLNPWLETISPLRTGLDAASTNLVLNGTGFTATPQAVRLEGPGAVQNIAVFVFAGDQQISVALPPGLTNGLYDVRVVLNDPASSVSNVRTLEVIPRLDAPVGLTVITVSNNQVHQLTLNGARLIGTDVRIVIDRVNYPVDPSTISNATQVIFNLKRLLSPGPHSVAVNVSGQTSHTVIFQV